MTAYSPTRSTFVSITRDTTFGNKFNKNRKVPLVGLVNVKQEYELYFDSGNGT